MARHARTHGFTLLEVLIAMVVLLLGTLGVLSLQSMGTRMNADARVMTKATAIAEDLVSQVRTWNYVTDARFSNDNTANDDTFSDPGQEFEKPLDKVLASTYDLDEDAIVGGVSWNGIASDDLRQLNFRRYLNVAYTRNAEGKVIGLRVAAIVRWERPQGGARRVVLTTYLADPGAISN